MRSLPVVALAALVLASLPATAQGPDTNPCRPYCVPSLPVGPDASSAAGMAPPAKACVDTEAGGCSNHWEGCSAYVGVEGRLDVCLIGGQELASSAAHP